jgi:pimeloyl-ACP methyl ester carboxylesterase
MAAYVLIHGAWHGGWCWARVAPLLRAAGHEVYTPTLTGLGERAHLLSPSVGLETHVEDVLGVLHYEDLRNVVLVGHSYGGMVITGVAEQAADRLAHLVYLDAFIPGDGQSLFDLMPADRVAAYRGLAASAGEGWRIPAPPVERYGVTAEADLQWAGPRVGPHPLLTMEQPVRCSTGAGAALPKTYIYCAEFAAFAPFAEQAQADPAWRYHELPTGHDAMVTMPRQLADLLCEITAPVVPAGG